MKLNNFNPLFNNINEVVGYPVRITKAFGEKPCIVILKEWPTKYQLISGLVLCDSYQNGSYYMVTELSTDSYGNICAIVKESDQ